MTMKSYVLFCFRFPLCSHCKNFIILENLPAGFALICTTDYFNDPFLYPKCLFTFITAYAKYYFIYEVCIMFRAMYGLKFTLVTFISYLPQT